MPRIICGIIITALLIMSLPAPYFSAVSYARVGLATLPEREQILIKLNRSGNALMQEKRIITVKQGVNRLEFSWINMNVDMNTVMIEPSVKTGKVTILSMSIPPGSNDSIVWEVDSTDAMELPVKISYLTNGIRWKCDYVATVAKDEKSMSLEAKVTISNQTVEDYQNARIQLDVGKMIEQNLRSQESKMLDFFTTPNLPIEKSYTSEQGHDNTRVYYVFKNDEEHKLGKEMLLKGKARLYRLDSKNKVTFLGEDRIGYVPRGDEVKLYLGDTRDIEVKRKYISREQENVRRDKFGKIQAYDTKEHYQIVVKNHKSEDVKVNVFVRVRDYWELDNRTEPVPEKKDVNTLKFVVTISSGGEKTINLYVRGKNLTEGFVIQ